MSYQPDAPACSNTDVLGGFVKRVKPTCAAEHTLGKFGCRRPVRTPGSPLRWLSGLDRNSWAQHLTGVNCQFIPIFDAVLVRQMGTKKSTGKTLVLHNPPEKLLVISLNATLPLPSQTPSRSPDNRSALQASPYQQTGQAPAAPALREEFLFPSLQLQCSCASVPIRVHVSLSRSALAVSYIILSLQRR